MKIKLGKKCFVEVHDGYNYTLKQNRVVTGESTRGRKAKEENIGNIVESTVGYHNSLEHAVNQAILLELSDEESSKRAREIIADINQCLKNASVLDKKIK